MTSDDLPEDVLRFIREQVDTVPHLEALLLLWESAPRVWRPDELAARLYIDVDTTKRILSDFARRKMLVASAQGHAYDTSNEHHALLPRVAETYRRQLVQVARFIHAKGSAAMQEFARAFKFKQDER